MILTLLLYLTLSPIKLQKNNFHFMAYVFILG